MKYQASFLIFTLLLNVCLSSVTYYKACSSSYTSLVDALKSIGVDSSFSNRKSIAALNGISNYSGTASQNNSLLTLLKQGKLIKSKDSGSSDSGSGTGTNSDYMKRLQSSSSFSDKKSTLVAMGNVLLNLGYEPAFVAGVLGNIYAEGKVGYFESSNYKSNPSAEPTYLKYMDQNYSYRTKYSGKVVTDVSLSELKNLMTSLARDNWNKGKFGLGCVQWTGDRTKTLVDLYVSYAKGSDRISLAQATQAEAEMIGNEFKGKYKSVYTSWRSSNSGSLNTAAGATAAGKIVCLKYEVPANASSQSVTRGGYAKQIFNIMMGK